jgi:conjugal transfer mating pair stabilization protein TraG
MSIQEVQDLQKKMVKNNGISSAVGKYQFLQTTLREAVKALGISPDEKFTPEIQDRLALWLLQTRTDYQSWLSGVGDDKKFQDQLAKIWASVPDTTGKSAYAGDGVNNATSGGRSLIGML